MDTKTEEINLGRKKIFGPPSQRKQGPEKKKTPKMANFRPKRAKYDRKNELF